MVLDANGNPINGTPRQPNSGWSGPPGAVDLNLNKSGPTTATAGTQIQYTLAFSNTGNQKRNGRCPNRHPPTGLTYISNNSGLPFSQPTLGTLVWQIGTVPTATTQSFQLTAAIGSGVIGPIINQATISTPLTETNQANNSDQQMTNVNPSGHNPRSH